MKHGETVKQNTKEYAGATWRKTNTKDVQTYLESLDRTGPGQLVILIRLSLIMIMIMLMKVFIMMTILVLTILRMVITSLS